MSAGFRAAFAFTYRERALVLLLFIAVAAPAILGMLPLDLALSEQLDLRPAARALVQIPADDGLWRELFGSAPYLRTIAAAGLGISIVVGIPAAWLISCFAAARALGTTSDARETAARGLGATLLVWPLHVVPVGIAAFLATPIADASTLAEAMPRLCAVVAIYLFGSSAVTVFTDFARGAALADPTRPMRALFGSTLRAAFRGKRTFTLLVFGEALLGAASAAVIATTRPLGLFSGTSFALALAFLLLRTFCSVAFVAVAARAAALRSA